MTDSVPYIDFERSGYGPIGQSATRGMGLRELLVWLVSCILVNQVVHTLNFSSIAALVTDLASVNLVYGFAGFVIIKRLLESRGEATPTRRDYFFAIGTGLAVCASGFFGHRFLIGGIMSGAALYLWLYYRHDAAIAAATAVLCALAVNLIWARLLFQVFTPELLRADAALVGTALSIVRPDIVWRDTWFYSTGGHTVMLAGACSSFMNVSIAILASVAMTMAVRTRWIRSDVVGIVVVCAIMIVLNVVRLCLCAWNRDFYHFWHDGEGADIFVFLQTLIILAVSYVSAGRRQNAA